MDNQCKNCAHWNFKGPSCTYHMSQEKEAKQEDHIQEDWINIYSEDFFSVYFSPGPDFGCIKWISKVKEREREGERVRVNTTQSLINTNERRI